MRTHRRYAALAMCGTCDRFPDVVSAENLAAARLEPAVVGMRGVALLDLTFYDGARTAIVAAIEIVPAMLDDRESSPLLWPQTAQGIPHERIADIERAVLPWIEGQTFNRVVNDERIRLYAPAGFAALFEQARAAGFAGAAPYETVLRDLAPYGYALRFAGGVRAGIRDPRGGNGAMLIARHAREVRADLFDGNAPAERWFGETFFGPAGGDYDLAIGEGIGAPVTIDLQAREGLMVTPATPLVAGTLLVYGSDETPPGTPFGVACREPRALRPPPAVTERVVGGSAGRVLFVLRDDFEQTPDADVEEARYLARRLRAEGLTVDLARADRADAAGYDVAHGFAALYAKFLFPPLRRAKELGVPVVLTPLAAPAAGEPAWGAAMIMQVLRALRDETLLTDHFALVEKRKLDTGTITLQQQPYTGYEGALRELLALAGAFVLHSQAEEQFVRASGGSAPAELAGPAIWAGDAADTTAIAGTGDFILAHAPLEPRGNQYMLARAAAAAGLPLLIAGPQPDAEFADAVRAGAAETTAFIGDLGPQIAAALYRRARVFADVSWFGNGQRRAAQAAASGAALVLARGTPGAVWGRVWEADPASEREISLALRDAWMHAAEARAAVESCGEGVLAAFRAADPLVASVRAYAKAASKAPAGA